MKSIEIDDDLYAFIASQTKHIGENASQILRRLLLTEEREEAPAAVSAPQTVSVEPENVAQAVVEDSQEQLDNKVDVSPEVSSTEEVVATAPVDANNDILSQVTAEALSGYTKRVDQFLFILGEAHRLNQGKFAAVEAIKGKNRTYFAQSKESLLLNGSSTNPKQIPNSPFWVVTNNNTAKKISMLQNVLLTLGYEQNIVETLVSRFS